MSFFTPKKKQIEYETEASLPTYDVDVNGFLLFDDNDLGGCGIFEIYPRVMTDAMTHADANRPDISTDDDKYQSPAMRYFGDRRKDVVPIWVDFINSLQAENESEDPIHIQLLLKKGKTSEWNTTCDYALIENQEAIREGLKSLGYTSKHPTDLKSALLMRRANDYMGLIKETTQLYYDENHIINPKRLSSYQTKMYLIVSYTPSSEGWWVDGRDSDYYVSDNWSPTSLFKEDKIVDRISSVFLNRNNKKNANRDYNTAQDIFLIEVDKTSYVIETRMKKIESKVRSYGPDAPFMLRRLTKNETAAIIAFYPNLLTPYMKKINNLVPSYNDIYHEIDNRMAMATGNFNLTRDLREDIIYGKVDLKRGQAAEEQFLDSFRGRRIEEVATFKDEFEDRFWDAETELNKQEERNNLDPDFVRQENMWKELSPDFTIDNVEKNKQQRMDEFLKRLKNRSLNVEHTIQHEEEQRRILEERAGKDKIREQMAIPDATVDKVDPFESLRSQQQANPQKRPPQRQNMPQRRNQNQQPQPPVNIGISQHTQQRQQGKPQHGRPQYPQPQQQNQQPRPQQYQSGQRPPHQPPNQPPINGVPPRQNR